MLVTAAGGKTGGPVVRELLARGLRVRAVLRREDGRAARLRAAGAEVVVGDLRDAADLQRMLSGVQRAYWAGPVAATTLEAAVLFASAAEEAGLEVVVSLSQWLADPGHPSQQTRMEWLSDRVFSWMPSVGSVTVDPGFFAENYMVTLGLAAQFGQLLLAYGDGLNAPPSNEDIGAVVAAILADPTSHLGQRYRPTGPALISPEDVAEVMARVLDRSVRYRAIAFGTMARAARVIGVDDYTIAQLRWYVQELDRGTFAVGAPTTVVPDLTGRPAESMDTIVHRYAAHDAMTARTRRNRLAALALIARVSATPRPRAASTLSTHEGEVQRGVLAQDSDRWRRTHDPRRRIDEGIRLA